MAACGESSTALYACGEACTGCERESLTDEDRSVAHTEVCMADGQMIWGIQFRKLSQHRCQIDQAVPFPTPPQH